MYIERKVFLKVRNVYIMECLSQGKFFYSCGMYISWSFHHKESCFKVAECIYHGAFITRIVVLQLRNVYLMGRSSQGKFIQSCGMYISWSVHRNESCLKVAECICHGVFIKSKVVLKLRNVYIMECSSQGKLFQSCAMYILWSLHPKESCFKVAECIYHGVFIARKVVSKLRHVYIMESSSQGKLF